MLYFDINLVSEHVSASPLGVLFMLRLLLMLRVPKALGIVAGKSYWPEKNRIVIFAFRRVREKKTNTISSDSFRIVPLRIFAQFGKMQKMSKSFSDSLSWNCRFSDSSNAGRKGCGHGGDESRD